jgi:uncharacterized protein (TIGR02217 family)
MDSFHDVRFPVAVSFGATGGPERRTEIVALTSGREQRNLRMAHSRRHFDAGTGVRSLNDLYEIIAFFEARRGAFHGFRFRDPFDMKSCRPDQEPAASDQEIGLGDGAATQFQLVKWYGDGADAYARPICKPVSETVRVAVDGVEASDFTLDLSTGRVTLSAPPDEGQVVSAGYEFDLAVRFDAERIEVSLTAFTAGQIPTIPIVEIVA